MIFFVFAVLQGRPRLLHLLLFAFFQVGDAVRDHQHHHGIVKEIILDESETPHPPKIVFEYTKGDGEVKETIHFPSVLHRLPTTHHKGSDDE